MAAREFTLVFCVQLPDISCKLFHQLKDPAKSCHVAGIRSNSVGMSLLVDNLDRDKISAGWITWDKVLGEGIGHKNLDSLTADIGNVRRNSSKLVCSAQNRENMLHCEDRQGRGPDSNHTEGKLGLLFTQLLLPSSQDNLRDNLSVHVVRVVLVKELGLGVEHRVVKVVVLLVGGVVFVQHDRHAQIEARHVQAQFATTRTLHQVSGREASALELGDDLLRARLARVVGAVLFDGCG